MSESDNCSTTPPSPDSDGYTSPLLPVPSMALDAAGLPPLQPTPPQLLHWAQWVPPLPSPEPLDGYMLQPPTPYWQSCGRRIQSGEEDIPIPPPHELFSLESNNVCVPRPPTPSSRSPSPVRMCGRGARRQCRVSYPPRSPIIPTIQFDEEDIPIPPPHGLFSPERIHQCYVSYSPRSTILRSEEEDEHFLRRWQQWDAYANMWVPKSRVWSPPEIPRSIDDYFYLNIRSTRNEDSESLVFSDFSSVLNSLLRTVFDDLDHTPLEFPIHRLFQKINVLQSKLDDARGILGAEHVHEDLTSKAEVFGFKASSECDTDAQYLADLVTHLGKLLEVVEAECKQKAERFKELLAINQISFDLLEYYYEEGAVYADYVGIEKGDLDIQKRIIPVVLKKAYFSDDKQQLNLEMEHLDWDGVRFQKRSIILAQQAYQGTMPITSLVLQRMTDETLAKVKERGRLYLSYCRVLYAEYYNDTRMQDELRCNDPNVKPRVRRVMIDPFGYYRAQQGYNPNLRMPLPDNAEENIARLPYYIGGYDFDAREWQIFPIWDLKPIEYNEEAWRKLVMDEATKDLIKALVDSSGRSVGVSYPMQLNKGKNILLNGSAGTGRMTTIHAICNHLKRPLLTISADDFSLGTDQIAYLTSLAVSWSAVIVVKDAGAFLKSTYKGDRDRVSATLRQLEGDDCVSFWVTSSCHDELLSSFCAVINFPEHNRTARRRLWLNHFGQFEPAHNERTIINSSFSDQKRKDYSALLRDVEKLSWYQLDGRMIENIVRSARSLADSNGEHLSVHHVKLVMKVQQLDNLPLWRKLTRLLMLPANVLQ